MLPRIYIFLHYKYVITNSKWGWGKEEKGSHLLNISMWQVHKSVILGVFCRYNSYIATTHTFSWTPFSLPVYYEWQLWEGTHLTALVWNLTWDRQHSSSRHILPPRTGTHIDCRPIHGSATPFIITVLSQFI